MESKMASANGVRITLAIAWKDILDSLKNRVLIGIIIGVATLMVGAFAMRMLVGNSDTPRIAFTGQSGREVVRELRRESEFAVFALDDFETLESELGQTFAPTLGVHLPEEVPSTIPVGGVLELTGFYPYWMEAEIVSDNFASLALKLGEQWGVEIYIRFHGNAVYPTLESTGQMVMVATGLVNALLIIGIYMTPSLIQEEKQTGTFKSLMVSPARMIHVMIAKSLAGVTYCLAASAVFCMMAATLIVHWPAILIAILAGSTFAVVLGLVLGTISDEPASLNLWLGLLLVVLLVPVFVSQFTNVLPGILSTILPWLPGTALSEMVRMSMTATVDWGRMALDLLRLLLPAAALLGLSVWRIRQLDR